jgi:hypothetical protein
MQPFRYALATTIITDPEFDYENYNAELGNVPDEKEVRTSIDLWQVQEVSEGWKKGTVDLSYYNGEVVTVKGKFGDWYDKHVTAKQDEIQLLRFPFLN